MTASAGAPVDDAKKWSSIRWKEARRQVRRLQMRIAKAVKENRWNKVAALQHLLTHSFYAKLLAVKRVTSTQVERFLGKQCAEILFIKGLQSPQAYPWLC